MPKYVFGYHGGRMAETPAEQEQAMAQWGAWFAQLGESIVDGGNPFGAASTIDTDGSVTTDRGTNPLTGYSIVSATDLDGALAMAKSCPVLDVGGSVEVCEAIEM